MKDLIPHTTCRRCLILVSALLSTFVIWTKSSKRIERTYTPDSYAMALIGRNIKYGLGFTTQGVRETVAPAVWPNPSRSFAPGYPYLLAAIDWMFGSGLRSGLWLNFAALTLGTITTINLVSATWFSFFLSLICLPLFYLATDDFILEATAARTMPVALMFLILSFASLRWSRRILSSISLGVCLAGLALTRFDHLPFAGLCLMAYVCLDHSFEPRRSLRLLAPVSFALTLLPWLIHNLFIWGQLFASDSSYMTRTLNLDATVMDFFEGALTGPVFRDDPLLWFKQRFGFFRNNLLTITSLLNWRIAGLASISAFFVALSSDRTAWKKFSWPIIYGLPLTATISLTKYPDRRYFSLIAFILTFVSVAALIHAEQRLKLEHRRLLFLFGFILTASVFAQRIHSRHITLVDPAAIAIQVDKTRAQLMALGVPADAVFGIGDRYGSIAPETYGYLSGSRSVFVPPNVAFMAETFHAWRKKWGVRWLILTDKFIREHDEDLRGLSIERLALINYSLVDLMDQPKISN